MEKDFQKMNRKEKINAQLDRLKYLEQRSIIKYHEIAQMGELRRELAEIEYSERNSNSSIPPCR